MLVIEAKRQGTLSQYAKLDVAIRTAQSVRNKCLCCWKDNQGVNRNDLQTLFSVLTKDKETPGLSNATPNPYRLLLIEHGRQSPISIPPIIRTNLERKEIYNRKNSITVTVSHIK